MKIYLFDTPEAHQNLLPLSFTRPIADFRCGILTIKEKWLRYLPGDYGYYPVEYLRHKYGTVSDPDEEALFIAGNLLPKPETVKAVSVLKPGESLRAEGSDSILAYRGPLKGFSYEDSKALTLSSKPSAINYTFDIFLLNPEEIRLDYHLLTDGRESQPVPDCVRTLCSGHQSQAAPAIFIEPGAVVECATINVAEGPVYIGKDSVLMEGACIRGPFALCEGAKVKMGAKVYEGTTIGPYCKVSGEVNNVVFFGYSNKSHDGFLGNAVIGEWCNIGAGVNASNLKNDYSKIRVWNYATQSFMRTDLQFCGLIMGDHSKIGVNCMINTATVMGVGVNLHGCGFPRTYIPCFSEGSPGSGFDKVPLKKFLDIVSRVMSRRGLTPSDSDIHLLSHLYATV